MRRASNNLLSRLILLMAAVLLPFVAAAKECKSARCIESKVDRIFVDVGKNGSPGVAVLVRKNGETVLQRAYGVRDQRTDALLDAHTNFRLASCTKQFTAMAVMLLVHDGKLRYEQTLTDIFPDFPQYGKAITIRHLLNHTS